MASKSPSRGGVLRTQKLEIRCDENPELPRVLSYQSGGQNYSFACLVYWSNQTWRSGRQRCLPCLLKQELKAVLVFIVSTASHHSTSSSTALPPPSPVGAFQLRRYCPYLQLRRCRLCRLIFLVNCADTKIIYLHTSSGPHLKGWCFRQVSYRNWSNSPSQGMMFQASVLSKLV